MPELGEIRRGREINKGKGRVGQSCQYIWHACPKCGKERWVRLGKGVILAILCRICQVQSLHTPEIRAKISRIAKVRNLRGEKHPCWKGGRRKDAYGYVIILLQPDDFFYPMASKGGLVKEHRLIMAKHLNRCLLPWEIVHHSNGQKDDNRLQNLELIRGHHNHASFTLLRRENNWLQKRVKQLEELLSLKSSPEMKKSF